MNDLIEWSERDRRQNDEINKLIYIVILQIYFHKMMIANK
jgi:hypothetical protein